MKTRCPDWLTEPEWKWIQELKRVAKTMPGTLCLHTGVVVKHDQYMTGMLIEDESIDIPWSGQVDGGDPDSVTTREAFEEWESNQ